LRFPSLRIIITLAAIACFTGLTALMSREWSEPNRLAVMLAEKHPRALRAQNALANRLLSAAGPPYHRDSPLVQRAQRILESSIALAQSSIFPEHRLIHIAAVLKEPVQDRWWDSIAQKLSRYPASHSDLDALERLLRCQTEKICPRQTGKLLSVFIAAVSRSGESPALLATYARFAASELGDLSLAERLVRKAISLDPKTPRWRMNLVSYLIHAKRWDVAQEQLEALQRFNRLGSLDRSIAVLEQQLDHARNSKSGDQF
ncbi:MAG: hypothetical protein OEQ39_26390, partial [Gammaproteobacteria bacterium]|nr:hypothetical protein [Gammaproteobacteria bacterium]